MDIDRYENGDGDENYNRHTSDRAKSIWDNVKVKRVDVDEDTLFKISVSSKLADIGVFLTKESLEGKDYGDESYETESESESSPVSEGRPKRQNICLRSDRTYWLDGEKKLMIHASWGKYKQPLDQQTQEGPDPLSAYPRFVSHYNRNLILNNMCPFFPFIAGTYKGPIELLKDKEESIHVTRKHEIFRNSGGLNKLVLGMTRGTRPEMNSRNSSTFSISYTENYLEHDLWNIARTLERDTMSLWSNGGGLRKLAPIFSLEIYLMFRSMLATGYIHGEVCPQNIKFTFGSGRTFHFFEGPYVFHIDKRTLIADKTHAWVLVPLLLPSGYGVFESDWESLTHLQRAHINSRYNDIPTDKMFGVHWCMAPEAAFLGNYAPAHEADLFGFGLCIISLAYSANSGNNPYILRETHPFLAKVLEEIRKYRQITKAQARAAVCLVLMLGLTAESERLFGKSPLYIIIKKHYKTLAPFDTFVSDDLILKSFLGNDGMSMLNAMLNWDALNRVTLYEKTSANYLSRFTIADKLDDTMSGCVIFPPYYSHWGIQSGVDGCVGMRSDLTQSIIRSSDTGDGSRVPQLLGNKRTTRTHLESQESPTNKRRMEFIGNKLICTNCSSPSKTFIQSSNSKLPPHTLLCSKKCESLLLGDESFLNHFNNLPSNAALSRHLNNVSLG